MTGAAFSAKTQSRTLSELDSVHAETEVGHEDGSHRSSEAEISQMSDANLAAKRPHLIFPAAPSADVIFPKWEKFSELS